jgi:hypothetical protein
MTSILAGPASHNIIHNGVAKPLPPAKGVHGRKRGSTAHAGPREQAIDFVPQNVSSNMKK